MSRELDQARALVAEGKNKKALKPLWVVESKARSDLDEARGLLELASVIEERESKGHPAGCPAASRACPGVCQSARS